MLSLQRLQRAAAKMLRFNFTASVNVIASAVIHIDVSLFSLVKNYHHRYASVIIFDYPMNNLQLQFVRF